MDKAEALNKQFFTFFTNEDRYVPTLESSPFPNIQELIFSTDGILSILKNLQAKIKLLAQMRFLYIFLNFVMKKLHQYYRLSLPRVLRTKPF